MNNILIITSSFDLTADYLITKFNKECNFYRLNFDKIFEYEISVTANEIFFKNSNQSFTISDIDSIYYRKIAFPDLSDFYDVKYHNYVKKELYTLITGIVESFDGITLTKPSILRLSENKIYQMKIAKDLNFDIPSSLISNNHSDILSFISKKQCIIKPISIGKIESENTKIIVQTNLINKSYTIEETDLNPSYYQEFIDKDYDLRITIIDNFFYSVKIVSGDNVDWRKSPKNTRYEIIEIPEELKQKCKSYLEILNMDFGIFDFVVLNDIYYFLEVNPNGQWAWLEDSLSLDISNKIFNYLNRSKN